MVHRFSRLAGVGVVVAGLLAGCTTVNPYTRESQTSSAAKGAGIGAAAGAVVGLLTKGDKLQNALIGAGVGALAGGGVGYYMDVQEAKLRQKLEGTGVSVTRIGDNITLNMPSSITFATNSADLNGQFYNALGGVAMVLKEYNKTVIEVAGHTDSTGSDQYNQQLSERRASSVANYLVGQGITQQRLLTVGAGESRPVASNDTEAGRAQNRRVEMTIVPITKG
ncbi:OmpA family protein [Peristeroidobacter soli]|jgi:outer membrane protein OmpA-like peptidoglycan-associated protein|uniref:OmpA family protein n=1 Tax=Peristeroidobacter soli TaxID=2497877 RepID=UPI00101D36B1|nr:OmpA family protein [Peristeroidobacter soli]